MEKYSKFMQIPANILLFIAIAFFSIALFGKSGENEAYIGDFDLVSGSLPSAILKSNLPVVVSAFTLIVVGVLAILAYIVSRKFDSPVKQFYF